MSKSQKEMWQEWAARNPEKRKAHRQAWEQSEKGKAWLKANQEKKNAARDAWRVRKKAAPNDNL
ncbi:MAG: hypothetical protein V4621_08340 [Pseudomonadota bacterium]